MGGAGGGYGSDANSFYNFGQGTSGALDVRPPPPDYQQILKNQILGQNLTSKWSGGHGAQDAANDMAKLMADAGITDIKQFGKVPTYEKVESQLGFQGQPVRQDENGYYVMAPSFDGEGNSTYARQNVDQSQLTPFYGRTVASVDGETFNYSFEPIDSSQVVMKDGVPMYKTGETFGNKETGQTIKRGSGRWERQGGDNLFSGTGAGKGNTGFRVHFGDDGTPYFYTTAGSSSDLQSIAPLLAIAQFIPGLQPFAMAANAAIAASQGNVLGALAGAAGLGGFSDVANAANFAGAVKSGNPLGILSSGANLGGTDLSGVANSAGLGDLNNIGGYNVNDIAKAYQGVKAIQSGDPSAIISTVGGYMNNQGDQRPASPLDSLVPSGYFNVASDGSSNASPVASSDIPSDIPSDTFSGALPSIEEPTSNAPVEMPIDSSVGGVNPYETPSVVSNPMELPTEPPQIAPTEKSFGSTFAQARASGEKEFLWNGNVYNTNLAPKTPASYDSVGGGRGGQGGATAEELARYNAVRGNAPPSDFANWASSVFPSAQAGSAPSYAGAGRGGQGGPTAQELSDYEMQKNLGPYVGYNNAFNMNPKMGDVNQLNDPRTYAAVSGFMGQSPDQQGFSVLHPDYPGIKDAGEAGFYTGVGAQVLPALGLGRNVSSMGRAANKVDDVLDPNLYSASGQKIWFNPEASRWTPADASFQKFARDNSVLQPGKVGEVFAEAAEEISKGNYSKAFSILDQNPTAQKMMLEKASFMGAQGVGPYKQLQHLGALDSPAAYTLNQGNNQYSAASNFYGKGKLPDVPRVNPPPQIPEVPKGYQRIRPGGRAEGGLASLNRSSE